MQRPRDGLQRPERLCARPSAAVNKTGQSVCPRASTNVRSVQHGANMQCSQAAFLFPHSCGTSPIHLDRQSAPLRMKNATRCSAHEFASARAVIVLPVPALPRRPVGMSYVRHAASRVAPTDHVCKVCRVCHGLCDIQYVWVSGAHRSAVVKETSHGAFAWRAAEEHAARWLDREARKYLGVHQRQHDHLLQHHRDGQVVDSEAQP